MFKFILGCMSYLHSQLLKVQVARLKAVKRSKDAIAEEEVRIMVATKEHDKAGKLHSALGDLLS